MSKTRTIVVGLAIALVALGVYAPAPIHAQQRPTLRASFFGPGASAAGVTVGDPVLLTATAPEFQPGWTLQIVGKRLRPDPTVIASGSAAKVARRVFSNVPGTFTFWAILYRGPGFAPLRSAPITVVWAYTQPTQLVLTVQDRRQTVNFSWANGTYTVVSMFRQGYNMGDPREKPLGAPFKTTAPVRVDTTAIATATLNAPLPQPWSMWAGITGGRPIRWAEPASGCGPEPRQCNITRGPRPGVSLGLGRGWAAAEGVEVWLCKGVGPIAPGSSGCGDPVAAIDINWTTAGVPP